MARKHPSLGAYSDLFAAADRQHALWPIARPGRATRNRLLKCLAFAPSDPKPRAVKRHGTWQADGVAGEAISWSVGYGPRTQAWVLRPAGVKGPLPGVIALHDHGGFKWFGKEKIADGPEPLDPNLVWFRDLCYEGVGFANALARRGFTVLVHDVFLWGSRRVEMDTVAQSTKHLGELMVKDGFMPDAPSREVRLYNAVQSLHEHSIEKQLRLLGTCLAGVVSFEDRVAAAYLAGRKDVSSAKSLGCVGLSGGGMRSTLLQGSCNQIGAAVVVGAMTTFNDLFNEFAHTHTWMVMPQEWALHGDWPDIASARAPSPLMVQYDLDDTLFSRANMRAAHRRLADQYKHVKAPDNYRGLFYPGPHKFDLAMQDDAFDWLEAHLR